MKDHIEGIISLAIVILGFVCLFYSTVNDSLPALIVGVIIVLFSINSIIEGYTPVASAKELIQEIMERKGR